MTGTKGLRRAKLHRVGHPEGACDVSLFHGNS